MQQQDRVRVTHLIHLMEDLKAADPHMPLTKALALLRIAATPGIGITELAKASGTSVASASRHIQSLGSAKTPGGAPLVVSGYGRDARTKAVLLTEEGRRLVNRVAESLEKLGA